MNQPPLELHPVSSAQHHTQFSSPSAYKAMAPDRGHASSAAEDQSYAAVASEDHDENDAPPSPNEAAQILAERASDPRNFTFRGVAVGLVIGVVICFSNMYFGLQTGWVSGMAMPSALLGFAYFKAVSRLLSYPFTPVENVLVQSVAGSVGTMPLGCGFVGVLPALNFLPMALSAAFWADSTVRRWDS